MISYIETSTRKAIQSIRKTLECSLKEKYGIEKKETADELLGMHGLCESNFDFIHNIEEVINKKLNDISIDDNSNKNEKTIEGIFSEMSAPIKKAIGYRYLYEIIKGLYGKTEAKFLMGEMYDYSLGLSDSTNILKPYCYSLDATKLVLLGKDFGLLHSKPSKRISSYISTLCEVVHQMSSHLAGAIAIGTIFLDIAHLLFFKEKYSLEQIKTDSLIRKYIENELQQFVHSVNHLSRNSSESPFTNISIFDKTKLNVLLSNENYSWYFQKPEDWNDKIDWKNYCVDYITECQNIFLDFFDKGDPNKNGNPYRFPIVTINLSKHKKGDKYLVDDTEFLHNICKRDIYRYNIFTSEGTKVASCCRLLSDKDLIDVASQANSFGAGGSISLGSHRVITINFMRIALECSSEEKFYDLLEKRIISCIKILKAHKELILQFKDKGLQQLFSNGWINLDRLFSTVGILGIYECSHLYEEKYKTKNIDVMEKILVFLNKKVLEYGKEYSLITNIEQIPAESYAIRLPKADRLIYNEKKVPYQMYSNQFIPLWDKASIWERMELDGKYNMLLTGGGIAHITIGEKVTIKQAEKIIKFAVDSNCQHFALNSIYSECKEHHISLGKFENCPVCEKNIIDYYTRVVGYFVPVSNFNQVRREWEFPKRYVQDLKEIERNEF